MNSTLVATAVVLRDLGCFSVSNIDDRILLQKKIYLAQDFGLPLGYGYRWYIHGPYSTTLSTAAYQIVPEGIESIADKRIKEPYSVIIDCVNSLASKMPPNVGLPVVSWYELLSSIAYWENQGYKDKNSIIGQVKTTKPQFSEEQIECAYNTYSNVKNDVKNVCANKR